VSSIGAIAAGSAGFFSAPAPTDFNTQPNALPAIDDVFNFANGDSFDLDRSDLVAGSTRATQARDINTRIPTSVQFAFRNGNINFYEPGTGLYYYIRVCESDGSCDIIQVNRATNQYRSYRDGRIHTVNINRGSSSFNLLNPRVLVGSLARIVPQGDNLETVARRYAITKQLLLAANPQITGGRDLVAGETIQIPALAYQVQHGDSLASVASLYGVDTSVLNALNDDPSTRSSLNPGTLIRVPVTVSGNPLAYTVHDGDSLPILSARLGLDQSSLDDLNPHIAGSGDLEAGTVIALPASSSRIRRSVA
jgi:LysM repeat protein